MALPNSLILGVGKAGTTSLSHYLGQHPDIGMSKMKEPRFLYFAGSLIQPEPVQTTPFRITKLEEYEAQFAGEETCKARMDVSPTYLMNPEQSILGIRQYVPEAKMIAIYRQPAERGYSNYVMHVRLGDEPIPTYAQALDAEAAGARRTDGTLRAYFDRGFYADRTKKFLAAFPRERFLFLLFDDLQRDPAGLLRTIFQFLEVDDAFRPNWSTKFNAGVWPTNVFWHRWFSSLPHVPKRAAQWIPSSLRKAVRRAAHAAWMTRPPGLDPALRERLTAQYRDDILDLQDIIGRDLSDWLREPRPAGEETGL